METFKGESLIYQLDIDDIQTVSQEILGRDLTDEEINKIIDSISENLDWFAAIETAIENNPDLKDEIDDYFNTVYGKENSEDEADEDSHGDNEDEGHNL